MMEDSTRAWPDSIKSRLERQKGIRRESHSHIQNEAEKLIDTQNKIKETLQESVRGSASDLVNKQEMIDSTLTEVLQATRDLSGRTSLQVNQVQKLNDALLSISSFDDWETRINSNLSVANEHLNSLENSMASFK